MKFTTGFFAGLLIAFAYYSLGYNQASKVIEVAPEEGRREFDMRSYLETKLGKTIKDWK